ncbi:MAG TPA: ATP-binding protein [Opitutaceae bacterium]|nr:ATP-binding protein [Opitutaceae bacterium]
MNWRTTALLALIVSMAALVGLIMAYGDVLYPYLIGESSSIRGFAVAAIAGGTVMTLVLGILGERLLVRRIRALRSAVEQLGNEKAARELQLFRGENEVARLARVTGTMALHLLEERKTAEAATLARSRFLSNISHEIRTPLNAVLGYTSLLRSTPLEPRQVTWLDSLAAGGETLLSVITNILDYEKAQNGKLELHPKPVRIRSLILDTVSAMAAFAESKELRLESGMEPRVPEIVVLDASRLRQVLIHLLTNAIKFTRSGSVELTIAARPASQPDHVLLEFRVHDTGPGIQPDLIPRLFVPFTQGDDSRTRLHGGIGMGLALCSRLVNAMGGKLQLESTSEMGTAFAFSFEAEIRRSLEPEQAPPSEDPTPAHSSLHVLVAEDNAVNRNLLRTMLHQLGHEAEFAVNGIEAFKRMQNLEIDVVLMDMQMPERDGCEATALYRSWEKTSDRMAPLPINALTANVLPGDRKRCLDVGMNGFLNKPILLSDLRAALARFTHDPTLESPSTL